MRCQRLECAYQYIIFPDACFIARFGLAQFNQFLIGKMDMLKRAHFAPKKPGVVDCSHPAGLARVAVLQQFYKSLRGAMLLMGAALFLTYRSPAYGDEQKIEVFCSGGNDKLTEYLGSDQKLHALWGQKGPAGFFYCGYPEGYKLLLKDLSGYVGNLERDLQTVSVYRGRSDTCSQGKLLIFNNRTNSVAILDIQAFTSQTYTCAKPQ